MFWCCPAALARWAEAFSALWPVAAKPLLQDGSSLHALERLTAHFREAAGFRRSLCERRRDTSCDAEPDRSESRLSVWQPLPTVYIWALGQLGRILPTSQHQLDERAAALQGCRNELQQCHHQLEGVRRAASMYRQKALQQRALLRDHIDMLDVRALGSSLSWRITGNCDCCGAGRPQGREGTQGSRPGGREAVLNIFFIVGAQKSGSTWLQRLIDAHPLFSCKGEGHFFDRAIHPAIRIFNDYNTITRTVVDTVYGGSGYYKPIPWSEARQFFRQWVIERITSGQDQGPVVAYGDKTPGYAFHLPLVQELFPEARLIHLVRDGRDVAVSAYFHMKRVLSSSQAPSTPPPLAPIEQLAGPLLRKWHDYCRPCLDYAERSGSLPTLLVRYEDLLAEPVPVLQRILRFLLAGEAEPGLDAIEKCVNANTFQSLSGRPAGQERSDAFLRKGVAGDWRNHFPPHLLAGCEPAPLQLLQQLGYPSAMTESWQREGPTV